MMDLFVMFHQIESMKNQLEAMQQMVGSEIAKQQEQAGASTEPEKRRTFGRRSDIPGAPTIPAEGKNDDNSQR